MNFDFLDILCDDIFIVANTLNPYQLVFLFHVHFQVLVNHFTSLCGCVGSVQNGNFILWDVDKLN
jgi:hypothetical protein